MMKSKKLNIGPMLSALLACTNPPPAILAATVEVNLTAKKTSLSFGTPETAQTMYAYNDSVPGPTIEANVGDTLRVNFDNNLDVETTLHWHGVQVPPTMDGSMISQFPIAPGDSYTYEFELLQAGTHWYHPHIATDVQIDMGLYGALIIHDPAVEGTLLGTTTSSDNNSDRAIILDDVLLDADGKFVPHHGVVGAVPPEVKAERLLNGKIGNTRLVNGDIVPSTTSQYLARGSPTILRFINVANTIFMRLSFPGQTVYKIGGDGGFLESPVEIPPIETLLDADDNDSPYSDPDPAKGLLLTPGERAVVVLSPVGEGPFVVEWHDFPVGRHDVTLNDDGTIGANHDHPMDGRRAKETLISWEIEGTVDEDDVTYTPPSELVQIEPIVPDDDAPIIGFEFGHGGSTPEGDIPFFGQIVNETKLTYDDITAQVAPTVQVGDKRYIDVANTDGHDHNFHLHGFHFQHIDTRYILKDGTISKTEPNPVLEWKDTIWMPRRPEAGGRTVVRLAAEFGNDDDARQDVCASGKVPTETTSGGWLAHCHMLEHGEYGMMSFLQVTGCEEVINGDDSSGSDGDGSTSGAATSWSVGLAKSVWTAGTGFLVYLVFLG